MPFFKRTTYQIEPRDDDWTGPEETLVDGGSELTDMEAPVSDGIFRAGSVIMVLVLSVILVSAGKLMTSDYERMAYLSAVNRTVTVAVPPPRGLILDRSGTHLVENVPSFDLLVISRQVRRNTDGTFPAAKVLADALGQSPEQVTLTLADSVLDTAVFFLANDIGKDAALSLAQHMPSGFYVITSTKRDYRDGEQFSSVLGYVGKVSRVDMAQDDYYLPSDVIGRAGIEASYESTLRGMHGELSFDATEREQQRAQQGNHLVLNIDAEAQKKLFSVLFTILKEEGLSEAAAIVQDPSNGAVLALTSFPSYDNNIFAGQLTDAQFGDLFEGERRPLFNRVVGGLYNPGSTIKPFIGMSALQAGVIDSSTTVPDCNAISIPNPSDPSNPYVFHNWRPETGAFNITRAIANSCNIFFFAAGGGYGAIDGLGVERIVSYLRDASADTMLGIDLPGEETGFVPDPTWKWVYRKDQWYQGDTYNISIGQGDLLLTPLWINSYVSAIANGGTIFRPQLAARVLNQDEEPVTVFEPQIQSTLPFDDDVIKTIQHAMEQTVQTGTARILQNLPVSVAAKTGTAEVVKGSEINSLLTVYAPADNPKISMTVLVEGSPENQGYAIRATYQFLSWYFGGREQVSTPTPEPDIAPISSVSGSI